MRTLVATLCFAVTAGGVACNTSDPGASSTGEIPESGADASDGSAPDSRPDAPPAQCVKATDCPSGLCNLATKACLPASCGDGLKNGNETDVDCGGPCATCDSLKLCNTGGDCTSGVCKDRKCQAPTNTDAVKNGNETGIDCGGTGNPLCADGQGCAARRDCVSGSCSDGTCRPIKPDDGIQNGAETDVDCGGPGAKVCADGLKCLVGADCASDVCTDTGAGLRCQPPSYEDGRRNGTETDIDCGGDPAHRCGTGKGCAVAGDCVSLGCNYLFRCAAGRSCTNPGGYGADTCGFGGEGPADIVAAKDWEDCCAKAEVTPTTGPTAGIPVLLDKYEVTAGRVRVFLESVGYNVREFVQTARAAGKIPLIPGNDAQSVLEPAWDMYLPVSFNGNTDLGELADCDQSGAETPTSTVCNTGTEQRGIYSSVRNHLGGTIFKGNNQKLVGCFVGTGATGGGTHAFRFPNGQQDGPGVPSLDQNAYDQKTMNCIDYLVGQAFCIWDGGRLELGQEQIAAWGPAPMPWAETTTQTPVEPYQRTSGMACATAADCGNAAFVCPAGQCVLQSGDRTYWGCRFPWATDASHPACGLSWPLATTIEYANYKYSYEYPKADSVVNSFDYILYIAAPGRTRGRGPAGHADLIGNVFSLTSNVANVSDDPQVTTHGWSSSGSFEVHSYSKPANGIGVTSNLLNKYGKLGLRCAYPAP